MITYHINYPKPGEWKLQQWATITLAPGTTRKEAVALLRVLPRGSRLLWTVDSAAELRRQTRLGYAWAKRMWHSANIPQSPARTRAMRQWSALCLRRG